MKNILRELHWLNDDIKLRNRITNPNIQKAGRELAKYEEILLKRLTGKNLRIFKKMVDATIDFAACNVEESFTDGAKIGARIIFELLVN